MRKTKKLISLLCCLALVLSLIPAVSAAYSFPYVSSWAKAEVDTMAELELIPQSLNNTDLRNGITRKAMCQMAMLSYIKIMDTTPDLPTSHPFTDTTDPDIERAKNVGLVDGDGNGLFRPDDTLNREEFFCFVHKFLKAVDYPLSGELFGSLDSFDDSKSVSSWAKESASICVGLGVVKGDGHGLVPKQDTTAEESILMFNRAYHIAELAKPVGNGPILTIPPTPAPTFDDLLGTASSWAVTELKQMNGQSMIPAAIYGLNMQKGITRSDMCKVAVQVYQKAKGKNNLTPSKSSPFKDTSDPSIVLAYELGIVKGNTDGTFLPDNLMTRQEFFQISVNLLNALGYPHKDDSSVDLSKFKDAKSLDWAKPAARLLVGVGILKGSNDRLYPMDNIIAEEALVLFYRSYLFFKNYDPTNSDPRTPSQRQQAADLVAYARKFTGGKYVYGGTSPSGFDCSGLVYYVYKQFGYSLYRTADMQYYNGTHVKWGEWLPGDLLFFSTDGSGGISHVGIYIGNNAIVHAANSRSGIIESNVLSSYYQTHYYSACRIIGK